MSVDILTSISGAGQSNSAAALSRPGLRDHGRGRSRSRGDDTDFGEMVKAQSSPRHAMVQAKEQRARGRTIRDEEGAAVQKDAAVSKVESGSAEAKNPVVGETKATTPLDKVAVHKQHRLADREAEDHADGDVTAVAAAAGAVPVPVVLPAAVPAGTDISRTAGTEKDVPAPVATAGHGRTSIVPPPVIGQGSGEADIDVDAGAAVSFPSAVVAEATGKVGSPGDPVEASPAAAPVSADVEDIAGDKVAASPPTPAPAQPGEATALLNLVKSDGPAQQAETVSADTVRTEVVQKDAGQVASGQADTVQDTPSMTGPPAKPAPAAVGEGARAYGLSVAAERVPDTAHPVIERVADRVAARQDGAPVPPVRDRGSARASSLAIAAVQIVTEQQIGDVVKGAAEAPVRDGHGDGGVLSANAPSTNGATLGGAVPAGGTNGQGSPVTGITQPSASLGVSLGQQVVEMGLSGRWIDDIARQIASIASNPGHGSFQMASPAMGTVRVDITPGTHGADVRMMVDNEAAQTALTKDQARLVQDAQLAAVRIGDIRIDRVAPAADAQRGDMGHNGQHGGGNAQAGAQSAAGQQSGQGGSQSSARQEAMGAGSGGSGDNTPKSSFTRAVIRDGGGTESATSARGGKADSARYA